MPTLYGIYAQLDTYDKFYFFNYVYLIFKLCLWEAGRERLLCLKRQHLSSGNFVCVFFGFVFCQEGVVFHFSWETVSAQWGPPLFHTNLNPHTVQPLFLPYFFRLLPDTSHLPPFLQMVEVRHLLNIFSQHLQILCAPFYSPKRWMLSIFTGKKQTHRTEETLLWITQLVGGQSQNLEQRALRASGAQGRNLPLLSFPMESVNYPRAGQGTGLHASA